MKKNVIFYHANCPDGFGAAWATWKKFGSNATYVPMRHDDPPPLILSQKKLYFLDITYTGDTLRRIVAKNHVTILDHHVSTKRELRTAQEWRYDVHHSGAILSWNFFHPHKKAPWLLRYIEDRDIWKWKLPNAKAILPAIDLIPQTFPDWNRAARDLERASGRHTYATQGKIALRQNTINVNRILKKMEVATFHGYTAGVVNSPILEDDLGDAMRTLGYPIAIIWRRDKGNIRVSLRSSIRVDVAKLAAKHGGGGHRAASGFSFPADKRVPWRYTKGNGRKTL